MCYVLRIMKIYTKTGDDGTTSLFDGKRVLKSSLQVKAYGSLDELSSLIGLVVVKLKNKDKNLLIDIQKDLYKIMSILAGNNKINLELEKKVLEFEKIIDKVTKNLPLLNKFILPGGTESSAWFHILRTICRRAERNIVNTNNRPITTYSLQPTLKYLNRLSDLFFTLARKYSKNKETII